MQTQAAPVQTQTPARAQRRWSFWYSVLGLQAVIMVMVSLGVFRGLLLKGGDEDARSALRLIAQEIQRSKDWPTSNLGGWIQTQPILLHRMADARVQADEVHYHGYRFVWESTAQGDGVLTAYPLRPGVTGTDPYRLDVPRNDS